jgi:DNA polymerase-3 subunit epsilon
VAGHRIDPNAVTEFISDAKIVIAHNAAFDRPIAKCCWPEFKDSDVNADAVLSAAI